MSQNLEFQELSTPQEMMMAFPLISQYYENFSEKSFFEQIVEMKELNDFCMIIAKQNNQIVAVAGYWILNMLYSGRYIQISNFIVDNNHRNQGIGKKFLRYLEKFARNLDCKKFILDSYTENKKSHNLYFKENFYIRGFHFMKDLD